MADETPSDKYVRSFYGGSKTNLAPRATPTTRPGGIKPFKTPDRFHNFNREVYALVEFPVKVILLGLQEVFRSTDKWRYEDDVAKTNIFIQDRYPQTEIGEAQRPVLRPAIVTERGPLTMANINGRAHNRRVTPQQGETGLVVFEDLVNVPMTLHCLGAGKSAGVEAERIASIVFAMLVVDEETFKSRGVHAILNPEIGQEGVHEQTSHLELVDCPVTFTMQYAWAWARRPNGEVVERLGSLVLDPT